MALALFLLSTLATAALWVKSRDPKWRFLAWHAWIALGIAVVTARAAFT